ncbi:MAG: hypothetical protein JST12_05055 [Armatimonadetes bacterium]|nr:hypothetical protein [Armatimonadota bacterium]
MIATKQFQPFKRRIKFLLFVEGAFAGLAVASVIGIVWAVLDWRGVYYFEWSQFGIVLTVCALIGAAIRGLRRIDDVAVARSIDRRADLKDRLGTSAEVPGDEGLFGQLLAEDATAHLGGLKPSSLYPLRLKRFHLLAVVGICAIAVILFFANSKMFLSKEDLAAKAAMSKEAKRLEELRKAIFDDDTNKQSTNPELMALQKDLQKLQKDYDKARLDPKEAMTRAEELSKKADELEKKMGEQSLERIDQADTVKDKMMQAELQKAGLEKANMSDVKLSDQEFQKKMDAAAQHKSDAEKKVDELQKKLDSLKAQLNKPGLDEKAKHDLENQINATQKELDEAMKAAQQAQKDYANLQLSQQARDVLSKIFNDPMWKEIQEAAAKLRQNAEQQTHGASRPKLSKAELEEMRKKIEELLKQLADDDARKEYLQKLLEALKNGQMGGQCNGLCLGLGLGLGLGMGGPAPGPDNDVMIADTGHVNLGKAEQGKGSAKPIFAPTERDDTRPGLEMTYEIKAPTFKGTKSSVPYQNVLPTYTKKAESALSQNEIPKQYQTRVKRYFESLKK